MKVSQKTSGLHRLMQIPSFYEAFQRALGGNTSRQALISKYIQPRPGHRVLDLGCGPAAILPHLGNVTYFGVDLNAEHIAQARAKHGDRGQFFSGDFATLPLEMTGTFDLVLCLGLLHPLDDHRVRDLARLAGGFVATGGRFVAVDPVYADGQPWIARLLAASDSGQNVRSPLGYRDLIANAFDECELHVRHDLLRIPYSHCITIGKRRRPAGDRAASPSGG